MKKSNVEIAKMVEDRGYDFQEALDSIDAGRTPEDEEMEITEDELKDLVESICFSFVEEAEMDENK